MHSYNPGVLGWVKVVVALAIREEPLIKYFIRNSLGNQIYSIYNAKCSEM